MFSFPKRNVNCAVPSGLFYRMIRLEGEAGESGLSVREKNFGAILVE
jgi:hypothetical protein